MYTGQFLKYQNWSNAAQSIGVDKLIVELKIKNTISGNAALVRPDALKQTEASSVEMNSIPSKGFEYR